MMKLYQKKSESLEDETVLVQLERRHTLKDTNEADSDNLRKAIRANSLGSFEEGHSSTDMETVKAEKQSNFSRRPTVITESELSSSWLYKDRKAKINSDDENFEDPRQTMPQDDHENLEPRTLNDPKLRPALVSNERPRKMSSCCWYFTIILLICIACLAVMVGVGGIVYMEYFAIYKGKEGENATASVKSDNLSASKDDFQHPSHKRDNFHQNEPKISESILKKIIKNFTMLAENTDVSRKVNKATSQPNDDIYHNDQSNSKNRKAQELNKIESSFVSENQGIEMTEHPKTAEHSDVSRNFHGRFNHLNVPISDKSVEIKSNAKNQDSLDLNFNLQSVDIMDKTPDGGVDKVSEQMMEIGSITEKSNSKAGVLDSGEETLVSGSNFNFDEMTTLQGIELKGERVNADLSFQNHIEHISDNSLGHIKNSINDNHEDNSFDLRKHAIDHDVKDNSFDDTEHLIDHSSENNSLDIIEHSIDLNNKSLNEHSENFGNFDFGDSSKEHSLVDDPNQNFEDSGQLVFIRPIVESKAVPIPLAFLRRIGFDIKNPNSHQPMTAKDMDIKFSLAEALKYLRSLDTESKLPVSREKIITRETGNQKESKERKLPIKSERDEYLNLLRKQIFEKSS